MDTIDLVEPAAVDALLTGPMMGFMLFCFIALLVCFLWMLRKSLLDKEFQEFLDERSFEEGQVLPEFLQKDLPEHLRDSEADQEAHPDNTEHSTQGTEKGETS